MDRYSIDYSWDQLGTSIYDKTEADVRSALSSSNVTIEDFKALISPAAAPFLEEMALKSRERTQQRFGKTIQMYVPLYLSNECSNGCVYCGFNHANDILRKTLTKDEILAECEAILKMGFKHLLLVTGEHKAKAGFDYLKQVIEWVRPLFPLISIEVQPMDSDQYAELVDLGLNSVYVYQETYREDRYKTYHPRGKKSDFNYRLQTPDRLGEANMHKIGLGALLGLEDWRIDIVALAMHIDYLEKRYWRSKYAVSFPRLRPHVGGFEPNFPVDDKELAQIIFAFRLFNRELEISLSTRENPDFRDNMLSLGITSMSAASRTEPGGYVEENHELKQFEISDDRTVEEVTTAIKSKGYEPVWKDWDLVLDHKK